MERTRDGANISEEGDIGPQMHDKPDVKEQMPDPTPVASRLESIGRTETPRKNPGPTDSCLSSQRTLKRRAKPMKECPAPKLKQTNIEKLVCHGERDALSAAASSVMILDDTGQPPPEPSPALPRSPRELPRPPQVIIRQTRAMRNGDHMPRLSSTKRPRVRVSQTSSRSAPKKGHTKNSGSAKKTPKDKSHPKADLSVPYHPYDLYVLNVIFNRFPALYLRSRHKHRKRPAPEKSLDIMTLIFRCRKAAARKNYGKDINPSKENSIVGAKLGGGAVFLRRNVRRCRKVWVE